MSYLADILDECLGQSWVSGSVGNEQAMVV